MSSFRDDAYVFTDRFNEDPLCMAERETVAETNRKYFEADHQRLEGRHA